MVVLWVFVCREKTEGKKERKQRKRKKEKKTKKETREECENADQQTPEDNCTRRGSPHGQSQEAKGLTG